MQQPVTQYAKSGDVHIAYQVFGEGPLNVIFVPPPFATSSTGGNIRTLLVGYFAWPATPE